MGQSRPLVGVVVALALLTGCAPTFKYIPNPPATNVKVLPMKVAVNAFKDGTEDFNNELVGAFVPRGRVNFARVAHGNVYLPAVPPAIMAQALADDLRSSGAFDSVDFFFEPPASQKADLVIDGVIKDATFHARAGGAKRTPWEITMAIEVAAKRGPAKEVFLTRTLRGKGKAGAGRHAAKRVISRELQKMLGAFRQELLATLALERGMSGPASAPKKGGSVEDILRMIGEE